MKIAITGASGMLGTALLSRLSESHQLFANSRTKGMEAATVVWDCFDLTDFKLLEAWLNSSKPDVVIHCAAHIDVDSCEFNGNPAMDLHVKSTRILATYLEKNHGRLIYISTDSVFSGVKKTAYREEDAADPLNVYAKTKFLGERVALSMSFGLVLRTNIVGWATDGRLSFTEWLIQSLENHEPLNLFYDVIFSPIHVDYLSAVIEKIIDTPLTGLYHCGSTDNISKLEFGKKVADLFQFDDHDIKKASFKDINFTAKRPANMALDVSRITKDLEYDLPSVLDSIILMKNQYGVTN